MIVSPLAWGMPATQDLIIIALVALLLFGKRLPEVGRSLGKGIIEFKKGLRGIEEEVDTADREDTGAKPPSGQQPRLADTTAAPTPTDYKFDPYTGKPIGGDNAGHA